MSKITRSGFDFCFDEAACETCDSLCCRGTPGKIWATRNEVEAICKYLNINLIDGLELYFRRAGARFLINEIFLEDDCPCVFLVPGEGCLIYYVRPSQCRTFPFWEYFKTHKQELFNECPGASSDP
jgi:Fe-S-cluster containining protein